MSACTCTHSPSTPGAAVSAEREGALLGGHGHDGGVDQAQLHDAGVVAPQTGRVMEADPRGVTAV